MTRAYDISYLDDAMTSLGAMLDYAVNSCGEDLALFYARFLASGVADAFSRANPKYLGGLSGIELATLVASRTGSELPKEDGLIDIGSPEYWTGWTLAYLSWYLDLDFGTIQTRGRAFGIGIAGLLAAQDADAHAIVDVPAGGVDDAVPEREVAIGRVLEIEVTVVAAVPEGFGDERV